MLIDVVFSLNKKYWFEIVKIVNYFRNRQYNFNFDCNFYEKNFDRKLKFTHFRKIENMKFVNIHFETTDWKKKKFRKIYCKFFDYENDNIYRLFVFDDFIYRFDKVSWLTSNIKRKTNQSSKKSLFEQIKKKVKQKTFFQINKISIFFVFKTIRFKKFSIQFIFDESRIVEMNFDDESIFFSFVFSRSFSAIETSIFSFKIIDHFIFEFFRFFRFFFRYNLVWIKLWFVILNFNNEIFFSIFLTTSFLWSMSWIISKLVNRKFTKKLCAISCTKWSDN